MVLGTVRRRSFAYRQRSMNGDTCATALLRGTGCGDDHVFDGRCTSESCRLAASRKSAALGPADIPWIQRECDGAAGLQIEALVKRRHFDQRFAKSRRERLHRSLLPVGKERAPGAGMLMPFQ